MPKRCYTCLIGSIIIVCIPVVFMVYYSPPLHTPIRQPRPSPTHIPLTSPFSQTLIPPTPPFSQTRIQPTSLFSQTHIPITSPFSQAYSHYDSKPFCFPTLNSMCLRTINEILLKCMAECVNKGPWIHFSTTSSKLILGNL